MGICVSEITVNLIEPIQPKKRRTQEERSQQTISKLVEATVECLFTLGYANATAQAIASRAELSQGAIFRHFDTLQALFVTTAEVIGVQIRATYVEKIREKFAQNVSPAAIEEIALKTVAEVAAMPQSIAWRELTVAARTNKNLQKAIGPIQLEFEEGYIVLGQHLFPQWFSDLPVPPDLIPVVIRLIVSTAESAHFGVEPSFVEKRLGIAKQLISLALQRVEDTGHFNIPESTAEGQLPPKSV